MEDLSEITETPGLALVHELRSKIRAAHERAQKFGTTEDDPWGDLLNAFEVPDSGGGVRAIFHRTKGLFVESLDVETLLARLEEVLGGEADGI